jgi:hypothetical protein
VVLPEGIIGQLQGVGNGGTGVVPDGWLAAKAGGAPMNVMKTSRVKARSRKGPRFCGQFSALFKLNREGRVDKVKPAGAMEFELAQRIVSEMLRLTAG